MRRAVRRLASRFAVAPLVAAALLAAGVLAASVAGPGASVAAALSPEAEKCGECHNADSTGTVEVGGETRSLGVDLEAYEVSRHGQLDCTGCHIGFKPGPHDAAQTEGWQRTARLDSCRSCHADVFAMYEGSFHGTLTFDVESPDTPVCADCHTPHDILGPETLEFRRSIIDLCSRCHGGRKETYLDSYHGKAFVLGKTDTATCTDCHGGHRIVQASDPESRVNEANLIATCGECHPGATENFVRFMVHVNPRDPRDSFWVFLFWLAYVLLIAAVFTFGGVHTVLYIYRGIKDGLYGRRHH